MSSVPDRSEIDEEYRWDLESIYATDEDWEEEFEEIKGMVDELDEAETDSFDDGEHLLTILKKREEVMRKVSKLSSYARMRRDEDTTRQEYQAMTTRAETVSSEAGSAASFIRPAIQSHTRDEIDEMVDETDGLGVYEHYLDDVMRKKPHTRSAEVEALISDLSDVLGAPSSVYRILTNADTEFPTVEKPDGKPVEITLSNFTKLQKNPDRDFRRDVYEKFYDTLGELRNTVGTTYEKSVKAYVKLARIHNYDTARESSLDSSKIPVDVYDSLVETVRDRLDPLHRHVEIKRDLLDVDDLRMWDVYMPLADTPEPEVTYDDATQHVVDAFDPLGDDYQTRVEEGLESRWVDVYENEAKRSGAYSGGTYDTQPFILMNYQDDISSMYTLAHELGHSLHSELTKESQPYVYSGYSIFVAEVASTVNEVLLTNHLLDTVEDDDFRRHVLSHMLEKFRGTLFRQTMFADFEDRTHGIVEDGGALTPDRLDEIYGDLKTEFYEPAAVDDRIRTEWMRIPHFYRAFYVFQYSTGLSAAVSLANQILEDGDEARQRYIDFLSKGSSEYPLDLLEAAGADMSSPQPVEDAIDVYEGYLDRIEDL